MVTGHGGGGGPAPFATFDNALEGGDRYPSDHHKQHTPKTFAGKVGTQEIDMSVYQEQRELNHTIDVASRAKNSGEGGGGTEGWERENRE